MPVGVIIDSLAVVVGGLLGALISNKISSLFKENINMILGLGSIAIGVSNVVKLENMPAVLLAMIVGTALGMLLRLGKVFSSGAELMKKGICRMFPRSIPRDSPDFDTTLLTVIVLFCASGTGIYGSIVSGMSGDHSIMILKAVLDGFSAVIFSCILGKVIMLIALPQFIIFSALFYLAKYIYPLTTPTMIGDFIACGGFVMMATGFRILKLKMFPLAEMLPGMILAFPFSWLWTAYMIPLVR